MAKDKEKGRWDPQKTLRTNARPCSFCKECDDVEVLFGVFYTTGKTNCHHYCLLLSSHLKQNGQDNEGIEGFLHQDISRELKRASRMKCYYCGRINASLHCDAPACTKVFHLPCGRRNGAMNLFHDQFQSYCAHHRPVQRVPTGIMTFRPAVTPGSALISMPRLSLILPELEQLTIGQASRDVLVREIGESSLAKPQISSEWHTCGICYDKVTPLPTWNTLWPPCCKGDKWFHRICVAKLALSAGRHYVKCPLCNNQPLFLATLLKFGFYVPDRDASWEREDGAFRELHERPKECYVPTCLSHAGRRYSGSKLWQLVICNLCGSQAAHRRCANLKLNRSLTCSRCQPDDPAPQAYDDALQEDAVDTWRDEANSDRDGPDSVIPVHGNTSSEACEAYLTMNNDLIMKTDKENVYSVRSIDSNIIKKLTPKKGELITNCTNNGILEKLLNFSLTGTECTDVPNYRNTEGGESSFDQRLNQTQQYDILNQAPGKSVRKPGPHSMRREYICSSGTFTDESENGEEAIIKPGPRRSMRRESIFSSRTAVDESDNREEMEKSVRKPGPRSMRQKSICSSGTFMDESHNTLTCSLTGTEYTDISNNRNTEGGESSFNHQLNQTQQYNILNQAPGGSVRKPGPRSMRRESICSSETFTDGSGNREEGIRKPGPRRSMRRESIFSSRTAVNESGNREEMEKSVRKPGPRSMRQKSICSSGTFMDESENREEAIRKPGPRRSMRQESVFSSRTVMDESDNREEMEKSVRKPGPHGSILLSNDSSAQKAFASYFRDALVKPIKLEESSAKADLKKSKNSSMSKYNGGKFKVKISPTSSKHKSHEKVAEQANVSSSKGSFKDKVEKYFHQIEVLRNKTMLNSSPILDTEQPLRITFKVEGYLSQNPSATSNKRKRQDQTQNQSKKAKSDGLDSKPCPKSKKSFYVENEEITDINDQMDTEEEASMKYKIINDEYAKVITSRRVFTVPIPKCPAEKIKKKEREKRKSAEAGQTNITSYFHTIDVKKVATTVNSREEDNENCPKGHLNQAVEHLVDVKEENSPINLIREMVSNIEGPEKQPDVRDNDFHEFVVNNCVELLGMSGERKPRKKYKSPAVRALLDYRTRKKRRNPVNGRYLKVNSVESQLIRKAQENGCAISGVVESNNLSSGIGIAHKKAVSKVSPNMDSNKEVVGQVSPNSSLFNKEVVEKSLPNTDGSSNSINRSSKIDLRKNNVFEFEKDCYDSDMKDCGKSLFECEKSELENTVDAMSENGSVSGAKKLNEEQGDLVDGKKKPMSEQGDLVNVKVDSANKCGANVNVTCELPVGRTDSEEMIFSKNVHLIAVAETLDPLQNVDVDDFINGSEIFGEAWHIVDETGESDESFISDPLEIHPEKRYSDSSKDAVNTIDEITDLNKDTEEHQIDEINDLSKDTDLQVIIEIIDLPKGMDLHTFNEINNLSKDAEMQNIDEINDLYNESASTSQKLSKGARIENSDEISKVMSFSDDIVIQDEVVTLLYESDTSSELAELNDANKQKNNEIVSVESKDECILILEDDDEDVIPTTDENNKIMKENTVSTDVRKNDAIFDIVVGDIIENSIKNAFDKSENGSSDSPVRKKYTNSKIGYSTNSSFSVDRNVLNVRRHAKRVVKFETPDIEDLIEMNVIPNTSNNLLVENDFLNKIIDGDSIKVDLTKGLNINKDLMHDSGSGVFSLHQQSVDAEKKCKSSDDDCVIVTESIAHTKVVGANEKDLTVDEDCMIVSNTKKRKRKRKRPKFKNSDSLIGESDVTRNKNRLSGFVVNNTMTKFFNPANFNNSSTVNKSPSFSRREFGHDFWKEGSQYLRTVTSNIRRQKMDSQNLKLVNKDGRSALMDF